MAQPMTAPQPRSVFDANSRGIAVLVVAGVVALLLLFQANSSGAGDTKVDAGGTTATTNPPVDGTSTTTTLPGAATTTTTTTPSVPSSEVTVAVLNSTKQSGAKVASAKIVGMGYKAGTVGNTSPLLAQSVVYYRDGYQSQAGAVAGIVGVNSVQAAPADIPNAKSTDNVIVVMGTDFTGSADSSGTTSTTTAGGTTGTATDGADGGTTTTTI